MNEKEKGRYGLESRGDGTMERNDAETILQQKVKPLHEEDRRSIFHDTEGAPEDQIAMFEAMEAHGDQAIGPNDMIPDQKAGEI